MPLMYLVDLVRSSMIMVIVVALGSRMYVTVMWLLGPCDLKDHVL
jgi:hypothetical protein